MITTNDIEELAAHCRRALSELYHLLAKKVAEDSISSHELAALLKAALETYTALRLLGSQPTLHTNEKGNTEDLRKVFLQAQKILEKDKGFSSAVVRTLNDQLSHGFGPAPSRPPLAIPALLA